MRILMLSDFYPPILGGLELHVQRLARNLVIHGHTVTVVTLWHEGLAGEVLDEGVQVLRIRGTAQRLAPLFSCGSKRFAPPFPDPGAARHLRRIIAAARPDVIHAHNWLLLSLLPVSLLGRAKVPVLMTLHDYGRVCATKTFMYRDEELCSGPGTFKCLSCSIHHYGMPKGIPTAASRAATLPVETRAVDMYIPVSSSVATRSGLMGRRARYTIVPNFVDLSALRSAPARGEGVLERLPRRPYILFVGAIAPEKGVHTLLDAYRRLPADAPPLVLISPHEPERDLTVPDNVTLLSNLPNEQVMRAWQGALFGVIPSVWPEPCPTVALEAMAAGTPLVASAAGGLPDIVEHEESGILIEPGNVAQLREAMRRLGNDGPLRARLRQAALRRVRLFDATTVVPRIEALYSSTCSSRARTPTLSRRV